jgi:hypothetical protein
MSKGKRFKAEPTGPRSDRDESARLHCAQPADTIFQYY